MRKVLRIVLITAGVILFLLVTLPMVFKSKIEAVVKEKVNQELYATVDWSRFSISLFRGFPDLSINLHHVAVVGKEPFEGDTLAGLNRFELRVNPFSVIRKNIQVNAILIDRPLINGIVLEDGRDNWDIVPASQLESQPASQSQPESQSQSEEVKKIPGEGSTSEGSTSSMSVSLKRFSIQEGRIYYTDAPAKLEAALEGFYLDLRGDFSMEETEMQLDMAIERVNAKMGGIRYLKDARLDLDVVAAANMKENLYTLRKSRITLNGLLLGAGGTVGLQEDGSMDMDLKFFSRETSFRTLLSLVPAVYTRDFEQVRSSGKLQLEGTVRGVMKDSILPDATLALQVTDGSFSYPGLPGDVSDVQVRLNVDYRGSDMDRTTVDLKQFHLLLGGNPFDLAMQVDHPVSDMHVAGQAEGKIDFSTLQDVVPMEDVALGGILETDLHWDTKISYIEQERFEDVDLDGSLLVEDMRIEVPDTPLPVELNQVRMVFNPRTVELVTLDMNMGASDIHLDGKLTNFIPYVFADRTISGSLNVSSDLLNAGELIPRAEETDKPLPDTGGNAPGTKEDTMDTAGKSPDSLEAPLPDSMAQPGEARIPENIDFTMNLDMKRVEYTNIILENIRGKMRVTEGVAHLDRLRMDVIEGRVTASGWVDTRGKYAETEMALNIDSVDIPSAYETFVTVERLAPMARYCRGSANLDLEYSSLLDASFSPLYETIDAGGHLYTKGLEVYNLNSFVRLSELLKNEKFRTLAPDEVDIGFKVVDGRVIVDPFDMKFDNSKIAVSGSHGIDLSMDYLLDMHISKSYLGEGANEMLKGITALAAGAGFQIPESDHIEVKAHITGTFNDPKVSTDLSGNLRSSGSALKETVEKKLDEEMEKVVKEVEKKEEEVRDAAREKADEMISEAEAEAERLTGEARKTGEALVKEAEIQGEKLIEEAGSNPLKQIAAKRAAKELKAEAEKQSEKLVKEAEDRGEELIRMARENAGKI